MMVDSARYPIPKERFRRQIEVERSRFIATVLPVESVQEAQDFIAEIKAEFTDANHNCWAYLVGPPGSTDRIGLSDDGEPHGVAGKPMFTALQHSGLGDIAVVVTRYFGGTKLGKGGMVKAYTHAVKNALEQMPLSKRVSWVRLHGRIDYALLKPLELRLVDFEGEVNQVSYGEYVEIEFKLPTERAQEFMQMFQDLSAGQSELHVVEEPQTAL